MAQEFNLPDKADPDFNAKAISFLEQLFKVSDRSIKSFTPITTPQDSLQHGDVWFDQDSGKLKVNTPSGVKTVQFEP